VGASITLTATVSEAAATGTVTFYDATNSPSVSLGSAALSSGTATKSTTFSTAATYSIIATYSGSCTYATSTTDTPVSITVTQ
jgi:hypothetical protein